ncbi:hypothetical protein STHERM_c14730 [Spirochaeta thermophila DSM 6192]|uniref:Extracellular endo-alpha-(1->5)-L-arabinanase C-terminal domain-containing protein n=1 Tax=Winmispira thermophila (strain ATCC 49972 / DSM 6192 / RI 19.B1) TaxID=665571 RepID=E0RTN8_WINT6|nr:hypothetical protein STHERM_c14730 [Spirochaeta thermophila DSM 6192]
MGKHTFFLTSWSLILLLSCRVGSEYAPTDTPVDVGEDPAITEKYTRSIDIYDPTTWGPLNVHDPELFQDDDGTFYVFSTDASIGNTWQGGVQVRRSKDLVHWECLPEPALGMWDEEMKEWLGFPSDAEAYTWAPSVVKLNGRYYMYHGVIVEVPDNDNRPRAWIGLAIADTPTGPYLPADEYDPSTYSCSTVVRYTFTRTPGTIDEDCLNESGGDWSKGFGAIDPEVVFDVEGNMWLTYGSWKGGIAILQLDPTTGMPINGYPADTIENGYGTLIAGGNGIAIEGACIFPYGDYYYLFYSLGDLLYDYSIRVGRRPISEGIAGPYYDSEGRDLTTLTWEESHRYGNKILGAHQFEGHYGWRNPGGQSLLITQDGKILMAHHTRTTFRESWYFYLQVRQIYFTEDGWPVANPNEYAGETLREVSPTEFAGTYKVIHTKRGTSWGFVSTYEGTQSSDEVNLEDAIETVSENVTFHSEGTISGAYQGTWSISNHYHITIQLEDNQGTPIGTYKGIVSDALDWSRTGDVERHTLTFTTFCPETGEYFFGNKE